MTNQDLSRRKFIHTAGKAGMAAGLTGSVLTGFAKSEPAKLHTLHPDPVPYTSTTPSLCIRGPGTGDRCDDDGNSLHQTCSCLC